jgi:glucose-6-phosphate isomerase
MRITNTPVWHNLQHHQQSISGIHMRDMFADDPDRAIRFSIELDGIYIDYSKHRITSETLDLLFSLADQCELKNRIDKLFNGYPLNFSEQRPALHTALRSPAASSIKAGITEISGLIHDELSRMGHFVDKLSAGAIKGYSGKSINTLINIGIGGSDLGPRLACDALQDFKTSTLSVYFVANIDSREINTALSGTDPETTMFIVSSKSFSTEETLTNAETARQWLIKQGCIEPEKHFIAITANHTAAEKYGITSEYIFKIWDWVGGRYSVWSAMGLPIAASIGMDNFHKFLAGAHYMDEHFHARPLVKNIPIILGLLDIWYINFFNARSLAIIPYAQSLQHLPGYLSQLIMESNGKFIDLDNQPVDYNTSAVILGNTGTNVQHAFMQLLHQGTHLIPVDFLLGKYHSENQKEHQNILVANCIAQGEALMAGNSHNQDKNEPGYKKIPGNNPSTTIMYDQLTPYTLGMLLALYEHRTFVQASIWNINPFDQWGVELGKNISASLNKALTSQNTFTDHDSSTINLIKRYLNRK